MKEAILHFATVDNVSELEPIFTLYREFYGMERDTQKAISFLKDRMANKESVIIFAKRDETIIGFVQLFPSFSSASLKKTYILNDLYVLDSERKHGVATMLLNKAIELAKEKGCGRISLSTANDNPAQFLYEEIGFKESTSKFYNYTL